MQRVTTTAVASKMSAASPNSGTAGVEVAEFVEVAVADVVGVDVADAVLT